MDKKIIWAIIGLMSIAVIGIVWLQMDLIRTAIEVEKEKFDKNVYEALNEVVDRLIVEDQKEAWNYSLNGFMTSYYRRESFMNGNGGNTVLSFDLDMKNGQIDQLGPNKLLDQFLMNLDYRRLASFYQQTTNTGIPIVDRIKLDFLNETLKAFFNERDIDTEFNYGVFSNEKNSFVIVNGHYVVEDDQPKGILPGYGNISNSNYKVSLFRNETPAPGKLMVHFPARTRFIWRSLWLNFLGTILFTAAILFCFGYTINVIFRQKRLSEMKTDFINNMTHEFKTPIATISLAADSITSPMISGNGEKVQRFAGIIKQENKRMNSQVEKVLQMALIDKRDFSLKFSDINLHEVIFSASENIGLQVERRNGKVTTDLKATKPIIQGDLTHVSNMINNLLDNANKYSPENPEISIHTRNVPNGVEVIIKDKGIGMSKEVRKHIFDKFYRVHTGDLHDVKGFGLGLSYVKAMITAHKGQIDVKSELGKGSSFILFFPFQVEH